jgi:hypothetical protein
MQFRTPKFAYQLLLLFPLLLIGGCATGGIYDYYVLDNTPLKTWPAHEKIPTTIALQLNDLFTHYQCGHAMMGVHFVYPLGRLLEVNSEDMAGKIFARVLVKQNEVSSLAGVRAILTPEVAGFEHSTVATAFDTVEISLDVKWTLSDPEGKIIWVRTVRGTGRSTFGNSLTYKDEGRRRVAELMVNLFTRSMEEISAAPEVRKLQEN